jgi:hypothetical protein
MALIEDDTVAPDTLLWRRILPTWLAPANGGYRPQSIAFVDRLTGEVSVFLAHLTDEATVMRAHGDQSLIAFRAEIPLSEGCTICILSDDPDPAHRVICHSSQNAMRRVGKRVSKDFVWVRLVLPTP